METDQMHWIICFLCGVRVGVASGRGTASVSAVNSQPAAEQPLIRGSEENKQLTFDLQTLCFYSL